LAEQKAFGGLPSLRRSANLEGPAMFKPLGKLFNPAESTRRHARRRSHFARLRTERLEHRQLMNADDPAAASRLLLDDAAATTAEVASVNASDAIYTVLQLPERFQSTAEFETWVVQAAIAQWGHLFGQSTYQYESGWRWPVLALDGPVFTTGRVMANDVILNAFSETNSYSGTNVQVEGVDEADLVETDGEYLYILSGQELVIVQAGIGDDLRVVSRTQLDHKPSGMYLTGNRLALVSSQGATNWYSPVRIMPMLAFDQYHEYELAAPTTTVTVFDITDRAAPSLVQESELDGQLVASRVVDGQLRLVVSNQFDLPMPIAKPVATVRQASAVSNKLHWSSEIDSVGFMAIDTLWWPGETAIDCIYESQAEYIARVRDELLESVRPQIRALAGDGSVISETPLFEATDLHRPESLWDRQVTTIATFNLFGDEAGPVDTMSVMSHGAAQVYSTADSVYLFAQPQWTWGISSTHETKVWKFAIDNETHAIDLAAKGKFSGALLNQFAADEHDGYLRVVTNSIGWGSTGQSVHVLAQDGDRLEVVGSIGGIAADEVMYSVRFMGERAFFVTFRKVDPLFAVDLSDPTDPKLLGELKIPGYSDYLQPIDENHLLAVGRGADETTGWFQELQVSIFDISDLTDPQLLHRYSFDGGRSTSTPVTGDRWARGDGDHHAASYFPEEQIFALPVFTEDSWGGFWAGVDNTPIFEVGHGGLQVFKIDVGAGFTPLGIIEHDTLIERSVRIDDRLFAISSGTVSVHELDNPAAKLGEVSIAGESGDLDGNGAVDVEDIALFSANFGAQSVIASAAADFDRNGSVDADDLTVFANSLAGAQLEPLTFDRRTLARVR
jgi:uncharacterized secreted protein with C-terminal beta-propeller domain